MAAVADAAHGSERRTLTRSEVRTLALAALGGALEYYDFIIFVYFAAPISHVFFPADTPEWLRLLQTWGLFAAGYLARPLGGIVMAHFGDTSGRKRMFMLSVLLMALPTLLIGLLPTYAQIGYAAPCALLLMRLLQGAAVGGEIPGAWTFVAEHVPERRVGFACGTLTMGLTAGILIGALVAGLVNKLYDPAQVQAWGWRVAFLIGGVFGFFAVFLRRLLAETPVFEELRRHRALIEGLPLKAVLAGHGRAVVVTMLLTWVLTAAIVVVILMTPTLLGQLYALAPARTLAANMGATLALCGGCVAWGIVADRVGAARALLVGCLLLLGAVYALYLGVGTDRSTLPALYALAGFCVGVVGVIPTLLVGAFPPAVRYSGISFAYNVAYAVFGGITPLVIGALMKSWPLAPAHYVAALCLLGMAVAWSMDRSGRGERRQPLTAVS